MKVFILGLSGAGKTTVSKSLLCNKFNYIDVLSWFKSSFRSKQPKESVNEYEQSFTTYLVSHLQQDPLFFSQQIKDRLNDKAAIVDGMLDPRNFIDLFNPKEDYLIVLNRLDNSNNNDYDLVSLNVIRDYCFWLSSFNMLDKDRWIEFNFKMNTDKKDFTKKMGAKNTLYLVKSIDKAIDILKDILN